jgi:hypothetical protein
LLKIPPVRTLCQLMAQIRHRRVRSILLKQVVNPVLPSSGRTCGRPGAPSSVWSQFHQESKNHAASSQPIIRPLRSFHLIDRPRHVFRPGRCRFQYQRGYVIPYAVAPAYKGRQLMPGPPFGSITRVSFRLKSCFWGFDTLPSHTNECLSQRSCADHRINRKGRYLPGNRFRDNKCYIASRFLSRICDSPKAIADSTGSALV